MHNALGEPRPKLLRIIQNFCNPNAMYKITNYKLIIDWNNAKIQEASVTVKPVIFVKPVISA